MAGIPRWYGRFYQDIRHDKEGLKGVQDCRTGNYRAYRRFGSWASPDVKANLNLEVANQNGKEIVIKHEAKS